MKALKLVIIFIIILAGIAVTVFLIVPKPDPGESTDTISDNLYRYICPFDDCYQEFDSQEAVDKHLKNFHNQKVCDECHEYFAEQYDLKKHIEAVHPKFECDECHEKFATQSELDRHEQTHSKNQSKHVFVCDICGENTWFRTQGELDGHMNTKHHVKKER